MSGITEETGWNQRRYDIRTYTTQNERNRRVGTAGEIPEKYRKNTFILVTNVL